MYKRTGYLFAALLFALTACTGSEKAKEAEGGAATSAGEMNPCAMTADTMMHANPCAANPCATNPCAAKNPCATKQE